MISVMYRNGTSPASSKCTDLAGEDALPGWYNQHMALRLKELRKARGYTQEQLGELVGTTHANIQRWETGKRGIAPARIYDLAKVLNCHPGEIFDKMPMELTESQRAAADIAAKLSKEDLAAWQRVGVAMLSQRPDAAD